MKEIGSSESSAKLQEQLATIGESRERVDLLIQLAFQLRTINPREGIKYCHESGHLSQKIGYNKGTADTLRTLGVLYREVDDFENALTNSKEALILYQQIEDLSGQAATLNSIGGIYFSLGDYERALGFHSESRSLRRTLSDSLGEARCLMNIGLIYLGLREYERAIANFLQSFELRKGLGDKRGEAALHLNLGRAYYRIGSLELAEQAYQECLQRAEQIDDLELKGEALLNLAEINHKIDKKDRAFYFLGIAYEAALELKSIKLQLEICLHFARYHLEQRQLEETYHYLKTGLELSKSSEPDAIIAEFHALLSEYFERRSDIERALAHFQKYHEITEATLGAQSEKRIKNLMMELDVDAIEKEVEIFRLRNVELAETNRALAEANQMKTELLSIAAHDLKNPLTAIINFAEMLESLELPDKQRRQYAGLIADLSLQMEHIIRELLQQTEIEDGKLWLNLRPVNLGQLVKLMVLTNEPIAAKKNQTFHLSLAPETFIAGDDNRLREIVDNLISNAIKYSPIGKNIFITVEKVLWELRNSSEQIPPSQEILFRKPTPSTAVPCILLSIRDEGLGMSDDDLQKVFRKFQRLSAKPTAGETATGLGLSIVKQLAELHGGKVWADSAGIGQGSTFFVVFPELSTMPIEGNPE